MRCTNGLAPASSIQRVKGTKGKMASTPVPNFPAPLTLDMVPADLPLTEQAAMVHDLCEAYIIECVMIMYPSGDMKAPLSHLLEGRGPTPSSSSAEERRRYLASATRNKRIQRALNYLSTSETYMWEKVRDRFDETGLSQAARDCFRSISIHADKDPFLALTVAEAHETLMNQGPRLDIIYGDEPYVLNAEFKEEWRAKKVAEEAEAAACAAECAALGLPPLPLKAAPLGPAPCISPGEDRYFHLGSYQASVLEMVGPFLRAFGKERVLGALGPLLQEVADAGTSEGRTFVLKELGACRHGGTLAESEGPAATEAINAWSDFITAFTRRPCYCKGETPASAFKGVKGREAGDW